MTPTARRTAWIALAAALAAGTAWMLRPSPQPVDTGQVARGPLRVTIEEDGETRIHPRYVLAAPVAGRLAALTLDEGDAVHRGDTLALLTPQPLDRRGREQAEANLRAARAARSHAEVLLEQARSTYGLAKRSLARSESLAAAGQLAPDALDRARTEERTALQSVDAAAFRVDASRCAGSPISRIGAPARTTRSESS
jgi:HlyD family secretion protein